MTGLLTREPPDGERIAAGWGEGGVAFHGGFRITAEGGTILGLPVLRRLPRSPRLARR